MKKIILFVVVLGWGLFYSPLGFTQTNDQTNEELNKLKQDMQALKSDIQAIKDMLQPKEPLGPTPDKPIVVSIEGGATKGAKNAKVTLVEFTDYQCPFCSRHFRDTLPRIENDYVKTGKVQYVLREFPLESIHPLAFKAAEAANCSGDQGKYWEMHDRLFANQNALAATQLASHAQAVGLDAAKFKTCLDSGKYAAKLRKDLADAQQNGINGTPTFFIGLSDPKSSEIKAVRKIVGAQNYAAFKTAIDTLLAAQ
jgi:protein-disulfide isomerase